MVFDFFLQCVSYFSRLFACAHLQSNMGAKNHGVIMPDANRTATLNSLVHTALLLIYPCAGKNFCTLHIFYSSNDLIEFIHLYQVGAAFGAAGQRCMALSVAVFVGEAKNWIPDLVNMAKSLKVNAGKLALVVFFSRHLFLAPFSLLTDNVL